MSKSLLGYFLIGVFIGLTLFAIAWKFGYLRLVVAFLVFYLIVEAIRG